VLTCAAFLDRLYDADAPDLVQHRAACADCAREWRDMEQDRLVLPRVLAEPAPAAVERHLRRRLAAFTPGSPLISWSDGLAWAAIGAALAVSAEGTVTLAALLGASLAFALGAARAAVREALL
jgi:hypothetical protein